MTHVIVTDFEAQVEHLAALGYPALLGIGRDTFIAALEPLIERLAEPLAAAGDGSSGRVPFVLVIASPRAPVEATLPLITRRGLPAVERLYPRKPNNNFSMLASRAGDKRVPALWLSEKRPKLGWCWAGNPHTWLGSASAGGRLGSGVSFD